MKRLAYKIGFLLTALLASGSSWSASAAGEANADSHFSRDGMSIDFAARPGPGATGKALREGQLAEIEFRVTEEATGNPLRSNVPAAWMDLADLIRAREGGEQRSCKEKIALYLKGVVGIRPMVDLNSYHVVVMNQEPSITIIDPLVSMAGTTSTLASVPLKDRGMDWVSHAPTKSLYVTMPKAGEVAVIDTDSFKVKASIPAGRLPTRAALQPDGRFVWIGNNAEGKDAGVTIIDTESLKSVGFVATGRGHHEIAFSGDSARAFVTNRDAGTVSVIDVQARKKVADLRTGALPIAIARSDRSGNVYVADGREGTVTVIDARTAKTGKRIMLAPGLGPLRFTPDGRYGFALDAAQGKVFVIDASNDALVHEIDVEPRPFQVAFSRGFAYVRSLSSERVTMVNLATVGPGKNPIVQKFSAGTATPGQVDDLVLADSLANASTEAAVLVVNPAENATYFYMEGMNAPSSNYQARGTHARAVTLVDRSLKEVSPGVYRSIVRLPAAGKYDVAVLLDSPRVMHCFSAQVEADPALAAKRYDTAIEFLAGNGPARAGERRTIRFRLTDGATGAPRKGLADVHVLSFLAPGRERREVVAREAGDGVYEADVLLDESGVYYVRTASSSARFGFHDLPYITIRVTRNES
ncbi:MAG: cytochrome D1 domain-containing protein [Betaproteobacteria bacterium]